MTTGSGNSSVTAVINELIDGVLSLTLNRPEKKNALTDAMYASLADGLERAEHDDGVRVVLLKAAGDSFTAGNDISGFAEAASGMGKGAHNPVRFMKNLAMARKPIVAAVRGQAIGIGLTMLLHCDLVFVAEDATLSAPFINLALLPEAASSLLMVQRVGHARAFSLFATGRSISGVTAATWGIANDALPAAEVDSAAWDAATFLAQRPAGALSLTKSLMRDPDMLVQRIDEETHHFGAALKSWEAQEAFKAFAERREPDFRTRSTRRSG